MEKICRICGELKNVDEFTVDNLMRDGYRNECKKCSNKIYYNRERKRELALEKIIITEGTKKCRLCGEVKDISQYHIKRGTPDGHRHECKDCVKNVQKKYKEAPDFSEKQKGYDKKKYEKSKDKINERNTNWYNDNKEEILKKRNSGERYKRRLEWIAENKERMSNHQKLYRERYPHIVAWRSLLYEVMKRMGTKEEGNITELLGYSALELKEHIEKQFTTGMSWGNHGEWHIDHKRCVIDFPPYTPVKIVCALSNLRPMWGTTREIDGIIYEGNLNKGSRSDFDFNIY